MSDIALQLERISAGSVALASNAIFDTVVYSADNISYNPVTGIIVFNEPGRYVVNWWVATQSTLSLTGAVFALSSSNGAFLVGASPLKNGEVVGTGIIEIAVAPATLTLLNSSADAVFYSVIVPVKATLVIIEDNSTGGETGPTGPAEII